MVDSSIAAIDAYHSVLKQLYKTIKFSIAEKLITSQTLYIFNKGDPLETSRDPPMLQSSLSYSVVKACIQAKAKL